MAIAADATTIEVGSTDTGSRRSRTGAKRHFMMAACFIICFGIPLQSRGQSAPQRSSPELWFGPMQDRYDPALKAVLWTYYDFLAMLAPGAPWQKAAHQIDTIVLSVVHAAEGFSQRGIPSLSDIQAMLSRSNFKVSGGGSVVYTDGLCLDAGIEGVSTEKGFAHEVVSTTQRWHDAGLPMTHFVMDGPFYFGYIYTHDKCHFTIEDMAQRTATTMKMIQALYPNLVIIDAEGPGAELPAQWLPDYHRFLTAFQSAYGKPIDWLDMDLHWTDTWKSGGRVRFDG
jgi:hypothetical protein